MSRRVPETSDDPFRAKRRGVAAAMGVLLVAAAGVSLGTGAVEIAPLAVVGAIGNKLGLSLGVNPTPQAEAVLWSIRFPRIVMGMVIGALLAISGAILQGVFRNPLADPQLLGIGPGASLGAVLGSVVGAAQGAIAGGAAAGLLTALVVRRLGRSRAGRPVSFILTGVALSAALSAWVGFVVFGADRTKVPPLDFWLLGSLAGSSWRGVGTTAAIGGIAVMGLMTGARSLDVLSLGESGARHLGIDVDFLTTVLLMGVGVAVGAATGAVGVIGFAGLLVPHIIRRVTGPSHRPLITACSIGGAFFVIAADWGARTALSPIELPVGLLTAVVGGPFFLWMIGRGVHR